MLQTFSRIAIRNLRTSSSRLGKDAREKRLAHIEQPDTVEGERSPSYSIEKSYELIDENIMDRLIDNVPFKKIPILYMKCTRNNTKLLLMNHDGTPIASKSCGTEGYKNCRKGTSVAAQAVANRVVSIANDNEVPMVRLIFDGLGPGRNPAFKVLELSNLKIVSLSDRTQAAEPWNNRPRATKSI